jgi:S-adenosylmethionine hydrolase
MQTIALLTDFGTRDPYVAAMKGVIASRCEARIADLTHCIAPFDVWEGAFFLRDVVAYWPEGTVFVCIVDPGVGSSRRILALESAGRFFLAPDNGLLHFVLKESRFVGGGFLAHPPPRPLGMTATTFGGAVFSVTNESLFLPRGSTTFHGRDRFAPVAAAIANGTRLDELGPRISDPVMLDYQPGAIIRIDRFGNCITDIVPPEAPFSIVVGGRRIDNIRTTYGGEGAFAIVGSTGCIEISVAGGSAATLLQFRRGDRVTIVPA